MELVAACEVGLLIGRGKPRGDGADTEDATHDDGGRDEDDAQGKEDAGDRPLTDEHLHLLTPEDATKTK